MLTKSLWFAFGLALSGMCLSGAYLQAKRRARGGGLKPQTVLGAYVTTGGVLACAVGFAVKELRGYGDGAWPTAPLGVWLVAAAWTISTLIALAWWVRSVRPFADRRPGPRRRDALLHAAAE